MQFRASFRFVAVFAAVAVVTSCRAPFEREDGSGAPPPVTSGVLLPLSIGSSGPDFARAVVTDASGNAYVASYFSGTVDFDASAGATGRVANGAYDIAIAKYAPDGSFQWLYTIGGSDVDVPFNIKLASDGALYVTGYVTAGATCNGQLLPNGGSRDVLVLRLSSAGTCDWAVTVGGTGDDEGHDIALAQNGDVLVAGTFSDSVDFDPGVGSALLTSRGGTDGFVARYNSADGTFLNVVQLGGVGDDAANALAVRADGDIIVAGDFTGTGIFGSAFAPQLLVSAGALDYFVARLASSTLGLQWAVRGGGTGNDVISTAGVVAGENGVTYVSGTFTGTASVGPGVGAQLLVSHGDADVFIANYDALGVWAGLARTFGGPGTDGVSIFTRDAIGNFFLGGSFQQSVDFDPGAGTKVINALGSNGASDSYLLSLTSGGDLRWVNPLSAAISGDASYGIASGIALANDNTLWAVGRYFGRVDFDPGTTAVERQSLGDADQFIVRYNQGTGAIVR